MTGLESAKLSPFLNLPPELRELIYLDVFRSISNKHVSASGYKHYKFDLRLMLVNRQIYYEARKVFRENNIFVAIETPWVEAQQHVRNNGFVPILITEEQAGRFNSHHLSVVIDTPHHQIFEQKPRKFIILLDDLYLFTEMWFYSDLSHTGLNENLRLTLKLQDPYALSFESNAIPKALQKRLLEPFGVVKNLSQLHVVGEHYASVVKAMKASMDTPYKTAEECIEEATRLKDEGNAALTKNEYRHAIKLYEKSFLAIHIVCDGRRRSVWGDEYFERKLRGGIFDGQYGQMVRLVLRIRLVANIIHAFLQLEDYEEAKFWGQRSVDLMNGTLVDEDDTAVPDFVAVPEMGKIYYRTAMAYKALGNCAEARKLLRLAHKYLPNDKIVTAEHDSMALQIGG